MPPTIEGLEFEAVTLVVGEDKAMHEKMLEYLRSLERDGRKTTATGYRLGLINYHDWLVNEELDPLKVQRKDIEDFQTWLAKDYRSPKGQRLGKGTQGSRLAAVKSFYKWLHSTGVLLLDPARKVHPPKVRRAKVAMDFLTQQEVAAMLQSQAKHVASRKEGSLKWAAAVRNLALFAVAVASGRRRTALLDLKTDDLDFARNEIRIEWEKGKPGRVLPCTAWAMSAAKEYVAKARPILMGQRPDDDGWLWIGNRIPKVCKDHLRIILREMQSRAAKENPDLEGLGGKRLGTHGLRVTFATMLFLNGANIRTVNELLMHVKLGTTSRYTPLALEDVRSALRKAHPRA